MADGGQRKPRKSGLSMAAFTKVTLAVRLSTIHTLTDNVITFAAGTTYTIWPAEFANMFVALGVIEEVVELHGEAVLHQSPCFHSLENRTGNSSPECNKSLD